MAPLDNVIPQSNDGWPTKLYTIEGGAKKPRNLRRHESKLKAALYEAMVEAHQDARDSVVSDDVAVSSLRYRPLLPCAVSGTAQPEDSSGEG